MADGSMELADRLDTRQRDRIDDLIEAAGFHSGRALDVGCREGTLARALVGSHEMVAAVDIVPPVVADRRIMTVAADVSALPFADGSFDFVVCAEVLEHIDPSRLARACRELARVARVYLLIGVPFRQDLRCGRTRCGACGRRNPPWGHVSRFDEQKLAGLFPGMEPVRTSYVGESREVTSPVAALLMNLAGNPYGTYGQQERCIHCGAALATPPSPSIGARVLTKAAFTLDRIQRRFVQPRPNWIHLLLRKPSGSATTAP